MRRSCGGRVGEIEADHHQAGVRGVDVRVDEAGCEDHPVAVDPDPGVHASGRIVGSDPLDSRWVEEDARVPGFAAVNLSADDKGVHDVW